MKPFQRSRGTALALAGGALALASAAIWSWENPDRARPNPLAGNELPAAITEKTDASGDSLRAIHAHNATETQPATDDGTVSTARTSALESSATWVDTVQNVLPDVRETPADWREFNPEHLRLAVLPNLPVTFTMRSFASEGERSTWVGYGDIPGATLVAIGTRSSWTANVSFADGNEYVLLVAGTRVLVQESNPDLEACGNAFVAAAVADSLTTTATTGVAEADEATVHTSDVLILYDQATETRVQSDLDRAGLSITPAERIDSLVRATLAQSNEDLTRSEITNFRWNVAGVAKVPPYELNGDTSMTADLHAITYTTTETGRFARDRAVELGADQTILFVQGKRDYAGLAWRPGHQSVCLWGSSHYVVAHELGHNLDCNHDRQTAGAADGGSYNYGHRYTSSTGRDTGTIMSYAGTRVPYFSNPNVTYQGSTLGVAAGSPKAADNARVIRENAAAMAAYRAALEAPTITRQPVSLTVASGRAATFSVTASGGNLSYQWHKDNVAISGATSDTWRRDATSAGDAGSYTVVVSNPRGSVTSTAATLTISTGASGGGGSGGGDAGAGSGGGAPSLWFLGALGALAAWRARRAQGTP